MKTRKGLERYQYLIYALLLAPQAWSSLHGRVIVGEAVLYCFALASSLFLAVLTLSGWGVPKKPEAEEKMRHGLKPEAEKSPPSRGRADKSDATRPLVSWSERCQIPCTRVSAFDVVVRV